MFRRAVEEGLLLEDRSMHVGIRGPVYDQHDFLRGLGGLSIVGADVVEVAPAYDHADTTAPDSPCAPQVCSETCT